MIYFYVLKFSWKEYGKGECYLRRPLPYSLLVFCAVQENHTRATMTTIKAFKKGVLYHGEDCNRGPKNDPPILEPAFLLVNR